MMVSRLFRPSNDRLIAGVCSGIGLYFGVDPVIVRLLFVVLAVTTGMTVVLYPILWAIMPNGPVGSVLPPGARFDPQTGQPLPPDPAVTGQTVRLPEGAAPRISSMSPSNRNRVLAIVLVGVGAMILISKIGGIIGIDLGGFVLPALLVGLGVYLLRGVKS